MAALILLLVVLSLSLLVVRVATTALTLTGLSQEAARFQARSAFTGTGFTTNESENVVDHPVRRRIIMILMLVRNAGFITAVSTLVLSFVGTTGSEQAYRFLYLLGGLVLLWVVSGSGMVNRWMQRVIANALRKYAKIDARDYAALLHLAEAYRVVELQAREGDWLTRGPLKDLRLNTEGVLVLGIQHADGTYIGAPRGDARVRVGDTVMLYGREESLIALDQRQIGSEGNRSHVEAVVQQQHVERRQAEQSRETDATNTPTAAHNPQESDSAN